MTPFYKYGVQNALDQLGLADQEKPLWRRALPAALGLGGSAALYALLRKQRLSTDPILRAIQKASKGKVTALETAGASHNVAPWLERQIIKLTRGADDVVLRKMTPQLEQTLDQIKAKALRGEKLPAIKPTRVEGTVQNYTDPELSALYRGDVNPTGNITETLRTQNDKLLEAQLLHQHMPGVGPKPLGTIRDYTPSGKGSLADIQQNLRAQHPEGYIIKPRSGPSTGGDIIMHSDDLTQLTGKRKTWAERMLQKPEEFIVQEKMPLATEKRIPIFGRKYHPGREELPAEWRIHTVGGRIVPKAMSRRYPTMSALNPFKTWKEKREIIRQIQPQLEKLPEAYRKEMMMAMDVARTPQGTYRIIETNPGGQSGFLAPDVMKIPTTAPHQVYKAVTGRESKPLAAAKAILGGGALAAGAAGVNKATE